MGTYPPPPQFTGGVGARRGCNKVGCQLSGEGVTRWEYGGRVEGVAIYL